MSAALSHSNPASIVWRHGLVIGLPVFAVLSVAFFGEPLYETNDDPGLAMVGAGFGIAAEPDPHLIFAHYGYGLFLNAFSRLVGSHAHGWTTFAAVGLSFGLFTRSVLAAPWAAPGLVATSLVVGICCIFLPALLSPQFTITAALLFAAALACRIVMIRTGDKSRSAEVFIYLAVIFSFLIRPVSALLTLVVAAPALLWLVWRGSPSERWSFARFLSIIFVVGAVAYVIDWAGYALSPAWSTALEYNQLRSLFNDYHRIPWLPNAPEYKQVGWSHNDYRMFMEWYANHPIFSLDNIRFLAGSLLTQTPLVVWSAVPAWLRAPAEWPVLYYLIAVQVVLCAVLRRHRTLAILFLAGGFGAIVVSSLTGRGVQLRVWLAVASVAILCTLPLLSIYNEKVGPIRKLGLVALAALALFSGMLTIQRHRELTATAAAYRAELSEAKPYLSGMLIGWGASLMWEWLITPTTVHPPIRGLIIPSIALFSPTPAMQPTFRRLGITDLSMTLCTRSDVRLVAAKHVIALLETFCQEHYKVRPTYTLVFSNGRTNIFVSGEPAVTR